MDKMYERRMALAKLIGMTNGAVGEINSKLNREMNGDSLAIEGFTRDEFLNRVMNVDKIPSSQAESVGNNVPDASIPPPGFSPPGGGSVSLNPESVDVLRNIAVALNRIADILKVAFIDSEIAEMPGLDPNDGVESSKQEE